MELTIRAAGEADLDTLTAFRRALCEHDPLPFDDARSRAALAALLRAPALGGVWLLLDGEAATGYVVLCIGYSLEFYGREAVVDELFVAASHRRRGVGRRALAHAEAEARALGVQALHLVVDRDNAPARELYRRVGYRDHDRCLLTKWLENAPLSDA